MIKNGEIVFTEEITNRMNDFFDILKIKNLEFNKDHLMSILNDEQIENILNRNYTGYSAKEAQFAIALYDNIITRIDEIPDKYNSLKDFRENIISESVALYEDLYQIITAPNYEIKGYISAYYKGTSLFGISIIDKSSESDDNTLTYNIPHYILPGFIKDIISIDFANNSIVEYKLEYHDEIVKGVKRGKLDYLTTKKRVSLFLKRDDVVGILRLLLSVKYGYNEVSEELEKEISDLKEQLNFANFRIDEFNKVIESKNKRILELTDGKKSETYNATNSKFNTEEYEDI